MTARRASGAFQRGAALVVSLALTGARLSAQEPGEAPEPPVAEDPEEPSQSDDEVEIIVRGEALRGRTIGGYEPEQVLRL